MGKVLESMEKKKLALKTILSYLRPNKHKSGILMLGVPRYSHTRFVDTIQTKHQLRSSLKFSYDVRKVKTFRFD